jgi:hypothetical protein
MSDAGTGVRYAIAPVWPLLSATSCVSVDRRRLKIPDLQDACLDLSCGYHLLSASLKKAVRVVSTMAEAFNGSEWNAELIDGQRPETGVRQDAGNCRRF